jgi:2-methylcitrate dehydratase PrpD
MAALLILDWQLCGRAGIQAPSAVKPRCIARAEAAEGTASVFCGRPTSPRMAAMVNGTTSHALDYDNAQFDHLGLLSTGIYPAALAGRELMNSSFG